MPDQEHDAATGDPQIVDRLVAFGTALREAGVPIRVGEMLAQRPELAEFSDCLEELLEHDPLVAARDGGKFQIA